MNILYFSGVKYELIFKRFKTKNQYHGTATAVPYFFKKGDTAIWTV